MCLLLLCAAGALAAERVALRGVDTLFFAQGAYTTSRTGTVLPQLAEKRGSAFFHDRVRSVVCRNDGWDGQSVIWRCSSPDLSDRFALADADVSCEGWDGPGDSHILAGSCSLAYRVQRVAARAEPATYGYAGEGYPSSASPAQELLFRVAGVVASVLFMLAVAALVRACVRGCTGATYEQPRRSIFDYVRPVIEVPLFGARRPATVVHHHHYGAGTRSDADHDRRRVRGGQTAYARTTVR